MYPAKDVGRNEPCPCGSGRKFKKCCADAAERVLAAEPGGLDVVALVRLAIDEDDWSVLDEHVDTAMALFEPGEPLEHIRFADDALVRFGDDFPRLCEAGWLQSTERALVAVLERGTLELPERDALRLAVHLNRRFGALSPMVEEVANLQAHEFNMRARRIADAMSASGVTAHDVGRSESTIVPWLESHPDLLAFVDWLALNMCKTRAELSRRWWGGVARRVCETCLDLVDAKTLADPRPALLLAAATLEPRLADLADTVALEAGLRAPTEDERYVHGFLLNNEGSEIGDRMRRIGWHLVARGDHARVALLASIGAQFRTRRVRV
jgi:hypothetical protein